MTKNTLLAYVLPLIPSFGSRGLVKLMRKQPNILANNVGCCRKALLAPLTEKERTKDITPAAMVEAMYSKYAGAKVAMADNSALDSSFAMKRSSDMTHEDLIYRMDSMPVPRVFKNPEPDLPPVAFHLTHRASDSIMLFSHS